MSDNVIVNCPHCDLLIFVYLKEFNCRIFRHGIYKATLKQIEEIANQKMQDLGAQKIFPFFINF